MSPETASSVEKLTANKKNHAAWLKRVDPEGEHFSVYKGLLAS